MQPDVDTILRPWFDATMAAAGHPPLFDAHTHIGSNDPDRMRQPAEDLYAALDSAGARGLVFPMHEPGGYPPANDMIREAVAASEGRLEWLCRVDPRDGAVAEARRCLDLGARGVKLHPRAEGFGMEEPAVEELVALVGECHGVMLIHAGRGIPALGKNTVRLSEQHPQAKIILAHAAISDIAWLWRVLPDHPNVFIDTSWWHPSDLIALLVLAPAGQVLYASDSPYGSPLPAAISAARCALQAGYSVAQLASMLGGQLARLLDGKEALDFGHAAGEAGPLHPLLERCMVHLTAAVGRAFGGSDPSESLGLARLACAVGEDGPEARTFSSVLEMLDLTERFLRVPPPPGRIFPVASRFIMAALNLTRTPAVPLPDQIHTPPPTPEQAREEGI